VSVGKGDIATVTFDSFDQTQRNSAGLFLLGRALRDHCVARGAEGAIVMIGSMYGQVASYPDAYTHTNPTGDASPVPTDLSPPCPPLRPAVLPAPFRTPCSELAVHVHRWRTTASRAAPST